MTTFPDLLTKSATDLNRARKPLGIAVLIVGCITIVVTLVLWRSAVQSGVREIGALLGPDVANRLEEQAAFATNGPQMEALMREVGQDMMEKFKAMPEEQQVMMIGQSFGRIFADILPLLFGFIVFSSIVSLWLNSFFLLLSIRRSATFKALAGEAITWMLPLLGLGMLIGIGLFALVFVPMLLGSLLRNPYVSALGTVLGFAGLIYLIPRLLFAPVILIQDKAGIRGSIRRSLILTDGKWWKVVGNSIGMCAMVWIAVFILQFLVNVLISIASHGIPFAFLLWYVLIFAGIIAKAYGTVFMVRLKESLKTK